MKRERKVRGLGKCQYGLLLKEVPRARSPRWKSFWRPGAIKPHEKHIVHRPFGFRRRPSESTSRHGRVAGGPVAAAQLLGHGVCAAEPAMERRDTIPGGPEIRHRRHPAHHVQRVLADPIR